MAGTLGAEFHPELDIADDPNAVIYKKGINPITDPSEDDSYSGFNAIDNNGETLGEYVARTNKQLIIVGGLALGGALFSTCVDSTAMDFAKKGKGSPKVLVVEDATRAIKATEIDQIRDRLRANDIEIVTSKDLIEGRAVDIRSQLYE